MVAMIENARVKYFEELSEVASALASNYSKLLRHNGKVYGNVIDGGHLWSSEYTITINPELSDREDTTRLEPIDNYLAHNLLLNLAAEFPEFRNIRDWREVSKDNINVAMIERLHVVSHRRTFSQNCEISRSWENNPAENVTAKALNSFLSSYAQGTTHDFYSFCLTKSLPPLKLTSTTAEIQNFIDNRPCTPGGRHAYYRAIRCFFNWAYCPASTLYFKPADNPMTWVKPPKVGKKIMPAQDEKSLEVLLSHVDNTRDKAIISTLIDSGGRLSEVSNIYEDNILWDRGVIKVTAKGSREVLMPLSKTSEILIKDWLTEYRPNSGTIWGLEKSGIVSMLGRLEEKSGEKCNAHTFRRGFASILRRNGVDSLDIMKLGHWKSLSMVQRYTESVDFEDSQKRYKAPTQRLMDATDGLSKNDKVPRPRIELGTRGFSVRCSTD